MCSTFTFMLRLTFSQCQRLVQARGLGDDWCCFEAVIGSRSLLQASLMFLNQLTTQQPHLSNGVTTARLRYKSTHTYIRLCKGFALRPPST
jgi:hypothetical protein